jgi:hypothetical protein
MNGSRSLRLASLLLTSALASCVWLGDGEDLDANGDCIGSAAGGPVGTPEPNLDQAHAAVAGSAIRFAASRFAWSYEPPALGWTSAGCASVTGADADADGFPDVAAPGNVVLTSCARPAFGGTLTLSGSATIEDADAGASASFAHDAYGSFAVSGSGFDAAIWTFNDVGGDATGFYGLHSSASLVVTAPVDLIRESYDVDVAYDPAASWVPGTPLVAGTLTIDGPWTAVFGEATARGEIQTQTALTIDPACPERITGGILHGNYATYTTDDPCAGPSWAVWDLAVEWTGCGDVVVSHSFLSNTSTDPYP